MLGGADGESPAVFSSDSRKRRSVTRKISGRIISKLQGIFSVWFARQNEAARAASSRNE